MSGLFRSVKMTYVELILSEESASETLRAIGNFRNLHIVDSGYPEKPFYKFHKKRMLDCVTWERRLASFREVMKLNNIEPPSIDAVAEETKIQGDVLEAVKNYITPLEEDLAIHINFKKQHQQLMNEQVERAHVLKNAQNDAEFRREGLGGGGAAGGAPPSYKNFEEPLLQEDAKIKATSISGVILQDKQTLFERMIFRVSKGRNALVRFTSIDMPIADPQSEKGEKVNKAIFTIVFVGEQLQRRIRKICGLFNATIYDVPSERSEITRELDDIRTKLTEHTEVMDKTNDRIQKVLLSIAGNNQAASPLVKWELAMKQEKLLCDALKKLHVPTSGEVGQRQEGGQLVIARAWVPTDKLEELKDVLRRARGEQSQAVLQEYPDTSGRPPTLFRTGALTGGFQGIVDTYGVPRYQEVNPGLFTCVTFPFLFGVMYGDIFHGSMLTLFAIFLLLKEKDFLDAQRRGKLNEMFGMAFGGRYLLIMMGLFAVYCGTLYNDCASIPTHVWHSPWRLNSSADTYYMEEGASVYPWGIDPTWFHKDNELMFFNSVKMKLSIILGVTQMLFGITLSAFNHIFFNDWLSVFFQFLPRFLFMFCTFGYMAIIIVLKMCINWRESEVQPPNLVTTMIQMFLSPTTVDADKQLYAGQQPVQLLLLIIALVSVPVMLFPMPIIKHYIWKQRYGPGSGYQRHEEKEEEEHKEGEQQHKKEEHHDDSHGGEVGPHYSVSEDLIGLSIHTIEFVLGTISNTASYLRLWALSLAHAELSQVFWSKMIMEYGLYRGWLFAFIGFAVWAASTFGVLLCMDVLECFLHALRLHWVEFQNKFFNADGYAFTPFDINAEAAE